MNLPLCAGCAICLLLGNLMFATGLAPSLSGLSFEVVDVGRDVTLKCSYQKNSALGAYWYKQGPGWKPQQMSESLKHAKNSSMKSPFKNDPRFKLDTDVGKNNLKISNVQMSDSAIYYCVSSLSFQFHFLEGIAVQVKDLALNFQTLVYQSELETIHRGDSATLNCTVHTGISDGEQRIYWLKDSDESNPRIIYAQGSGRTQCEVKPNTQTHTCVYNLPLENLNASHAGTYYCAVASCGHVLFGNGTKLDYKEKLDSPVLLYVLTGTLVFVVVLMGLLVFTSHKLCASGLSFLLTFVKGVTVVVKDSAVGGKALVHQAASESARPGDSVTLNCTIQTGSCREERRVYWFRKSSKYDPGLVYAHGDMADQCLTSSDTQTHTCLYKLPMANIKKSQVGTYYCAVDSCGQIAFGKGTKLALESEALSLVLVFFLCAALIFTIVLNVLLAVKLYKKHNKDSCQASAFQGKSLSCPAADGEEDNLHYAAVNVNKPTGSRRQKKSQETECVYSSMKQ